MVPGKGEENRNRKQRSTTDTISFLLDSGEKRKQQVRVRGNGVDGSLYADDLAIYITTNSHKVASTALQGVTSKLDAWAPDRV